MIGSWGELVLLFCSTLAVAVPQLLVQQQPDAPDPPKSHHRSLQWGSINFLHTTDVHVLHIVGRLLICRVG
jgi:2',3'-cyclic-nucleotide 2'-phosphodiesterase (5'-nucleotidase family)